MPKKREPYIAVELVMIDLAGPVAALAGKSEAEVGWGLIKLWRHAWRSRTDVVPTAVVEGFVPGCLPALQAFEFAEPLDDPPRHTRLRGLVERYSRIAEARREGARKTNAQRYGSGSVSDRSATVSAPKWSGASEIGSVSEGKREDRREKTEDQVEAPLGLDQPKPKRAARAASRWEVLYGELQVARMERLEVLKLDAAPQVLPASRINHLLKAAAARLPESLTTAPVDERGDDLLALWKRYLWSAYWRTKSPPFPLEGFVSAPVLERLAGLWGSVTDPCESGEEFK